MLRFEPLVWIVAPLLSILPLTPVERAVPGPASQEAVASGIDLSSPARAYATCLERLPEDPALVLDTCFTEHGREKFLLSLVVAAAMAEGFAEQSDTTDAAKRVRSILEEYGLGGEFEKQEEFIDALNRVDVSSFVPAMVEALDGAGPRRPGPGVLRDLKVDGDRATGVESFGRAGEETTGQLLIFRRRDDRWRVDDWEPGTPGFGSGRANDASP